MMSRKSPIYRVKFIINQSEYNVYVKHCQSSHLFGFIELGGFLWDQHTQLVLDPSHEKLKAEFDGVESTQVPIHNIIRIDEVSSVGTAKIGDLSGNVMPFTKPIYTQTPK